MPLLRFFDDALAAVRGDGVLGHLVRERHEAAPEEAARLLGFRPEVPIDEGIREAVAWCRQAGWI